MFFKKFIRSQLPGSRFTVVTSTKVIMVSHFLPFVEPVPTINVGSWVGWICHLPWEDSFAADLPSLFRGTESHPRLGAHHRGEGVVARDEGCGHDGDMGEQRAAGHPRGNLHLLPIAFMVKRVGTNKGGASHLFHLSPIYSPASAVSRDSNGFPQFICLPAQNPLFLSITQKQSLYMSTISSQESHLATGISLSPFLNHSPMSPPWGFSPLPLVI